MKNVKIVADSAANTVALDTLPFAFAPMKISTADREFVDDAALDVAELVDFFDRCKDRSHTACPSPADWLEAFGDADEIFCVTITSGLSGSYNAACAAKQMYEAEHPGARVCVLDTLSAGPEMTLIVEKLEELISSGLDFDAVEAAIREYMGKTGLFFQLESLKNFAANGRVSPAVAKLTGLLGIRIVGRASAKGTLEPLRKCRGQAHSFDGLCKLLSDAGARGKILIAHCRNEAGAEELKAAVEAALPQVSVRIAPCRGLCSYYAEKGGLLVGFER